LFQTSLPSSSEVTESAESLEASLLKKASIVAVSGECNNDERAVFLIDGDENTKWCDVKPAPSYVVFDLGATQRVSRWRLINAGTEDFSYITRTCLLQTRLNENEDWVTVDMIDQNRSNVVERRFKSVEARYVRLFVVGPAQTTGDATRIYEFELF
jgi:alpha-mannosidase